MGTKSTRSSGTQHNQRGVTQGVTLVDPKTGLPVAVVLGADGKYRLAVDANVTANISGVDVALDGVGPDGDSVYLVDNVTGNKFKINADGSIDTNVSIDALSGDNIGIKNTVSGNELKINADGSIDANVNISGTGVSTPVIVNVAIPVANTEQSYAFPANTKRFTMKARGNAKLQLSFVSGDSGTNFVTIFPGNVHEETGLSVSVLTVYYQSSKANETAEILSWS